MAPKLTGLISLCFSALVIYTVAICKEKRSKTYHRLLFGISCVDISSSFWLGLSTWPIPKETGIIWASGNTQTCTLQGFFTQFGVASSFYNASLSVYYLLVIRYGWKEASIHKIEPFLHAFPISWGLGTAIAGLPLTIFNSANLWCWVAPYQDRGTDADLYRWVLFYGPLWLMILVVTVSLILIFQHVRKIEKATERYRFGGVGASSGLSSSDEALKPGGSIGQMRESSDDDMAVLHEEEDEEDASPMEVGGGLQDIEEGQDDEGINEGELDMEMNCNSGATADETGAFQAPESPQSTTGDTSNVASKNVPTAKRQSRPTIHNNDKDVSESSNSQHFYSFLSRRNSRRKSALGTGERNRRKARRSREVANQSLRYAGSFYFTWFALTVSI
jgi:hypothetical protein